MNGVKERFWEKVDKKSESECWPWKGALNSGGYGMIGVKIEGEWKNRNAHRISYKLNKGEIPEGEGYHGTCVLHSCDNRKCVNPNHLFLGTNEDNQKDKKLKGRCARGEENGKSKLTKEEVKQIKELLAKENGPTHKELAEMFGVKYPTIGSIKQGISWSHVEV